MKHFAYAVLCGAILEIGAATLAGQAAEAAHAPDYRAIERIAPLYFPPVARAPFLATAHTLWVKNLPDGSTVTTENERIVARDSAGRVFEERRTFLPVPNPTNKQSNTYATEYDDPVAQTIDRCAPMAHRCDVFQFYMPPDNRLPAGLQPDGTTYLTRENLGTDTFAGLDVEHSRETFTFYKQSIGNTNTILRSVEYWYSAALSVNVEVKRHDPRDGNQTLWLSDISLIEAESKYFQVPDDYQLIDHRVGSAQQNQRGMTGPDLPPRREPPGKVTVSAGVSAGLLVNRVQAEYPAEARAARVQGTVVVQIMVGKDGGVEDARVVSGPSMLSDAALDAVRQWIYRPYLLNGQPVEVETTGNVTFRLNE